MKQVGTKVRILREILGYNQNEMSELMNISQPLLAQIENGNRKLTPKNRDKICEIFDISVETFTENNPEELLNKLFIMSRNLFIPYMDIQENEYILTLNFTEE